MLAPFARKRTAVPACSKVSLSAAKAAEDKE